jgi:archaellum component FlaC
MQVEIAIKKMNLNSYRELIEAIENMLGVFDTPIARKKITGDIANEARKQAREIIDRYNAYQTAKKEIIGGIQDFANKKEFIENAERFFGKGE